MIAFYYSPFYQSSYKYTFLHITWHTNSITHITYKILWHQLLKQMITNNGAVMISKNTFPLK